MKRSIVLLLTIALLVPTVASPAGEPVTFAYSQIGLLAHLPWSVALGQKYFEEQGLEPKGFNFDTGGKSIAALIGGSADFAANALEHAIKAKVQGKDLVYVFSSTRLPGFGLIVASAQKGEIKSVADLRGKPVGVSGIGVASHVLLDYMLKRNGVDPKDVDIKVAGSVITVKGSREEKHETEKRDFYRREFRYGSFERSITLPEGMKAEDLKATFHDGVLELTAPMPKEALPKEVKVQIQSGEAKKPDGDKKAA